MTIYDFLTSVLDDGSFDVPCRRVIKFADADLRTAGVLKGTINSGVIVFDDPKPKANAGGCLVTILQIEPDSPDGAMVSANVPVFGLQKKRITIADA